MAENIYTFKNNAFPYNDLSLANPHGLQGGAYFSKFKLLGNSISLQTPKSKTKNGIIKTDKKIYCDLLFNKDDDEVIEFISQLEDKIKNLIYEKKEKWFHTDMDMDTIDYHWQNVLRPYKGSYILLRCFIKKPKSSLHASSPVQIYNEDEELLDLDKVTKDKTIVSLLDLTGLKFTSQSFSLEFNLTQIMVLKDEIKYNKCLIKKDSLEKTNTLEKSKDIESTGISQEMKGESDIKQEKKDVVMDVETSPEEKLTPEPESEDAIQTASHDHPHQSSDIEKNIENTQDESKQHTKNSDIDSEKKMGHLKELHESEESEELDELNEINLEIPEELDTVQLKNPNEVYLEIYREVKKRAKDAKKKAIEAYLEAKRIKSLYLLDEIESSDDESELLAITEDE